MCAVLNKTKRLFQKSFTKYGFGPINYIRDESTGKVKVSPAPLVHTHDGMMMLVKVGTMDKLQTIASHNLGRGTRVEIEKDAKAILRKHGASVRAALGLAMNSTDPRAAVTEVVLDHQSASVSSAKAYFSAGKAKLAYESGKYDEAMELTIDAALNLISAGALYNQERASKKASESADGTHLSNRKRESKAREFFQSRSWKARGGKAEAARAISKDFHVAYKVAERWVTAWSRERA